MLHQQVEAEKYEFEQNLLKQKELKEIEAKLEKERKDLLKQHSLEIKKQILLK